MWNAMAESLGEVLLVGPIPVQVQPVLPGTIPVLDWFAQERGFEGATHLV